MSIISLLVIVLAVVALERSETSTKNFGASDNLENSFALDFNTDTAASGKIATSSNNSGCPANLVPIGIMSINRPPKILCVEDLTRKNLDQRIYSYYGYYSTYNKVVYPLDTELGVDTKPNTIICPEILVASSSDPLITKYSQHPNTKRSEYFNDQGFFVFKIDNTNLYHLNGEQKSMLLHSNLNNLVRISIQQAPSAEKGCEMECCKGFVDVVNVGK